MEGDVHLSADRLIGPFEFELRRRRQGRQLRAARDMESARGRAEGASHRVGHRRDSAVMPESSPSDGNGLICRWRHEGRVEKFLDTCTFNRYPFFIAVESVGPNLQITSVCMTTLAIREFEES